MKEIKFKPLVPGQIEVRPTDTKTQGSATLLLYIDSRSAADILNESVGELNWTIEYKPVGDKVFGRLSIWDEDKKMWIFREDTGEESNIAASKGMSSDILKRCLARFGCDYLYHTPRVKLRNLPQSYYYDGKLTMSFYVKEIEWDGKNCFKLVIADRFGKVVYDWDAKTGVKAQNEPVQAPQAQGSSETPLESLTAFCKAKKGQGLDNVLKDFYNYYKNLFETKGWNGRFLAEARWKSWCERERS